MEKETKRSRLQNHKLICSLPTNQIHQVNEFKSYLIIFNDFLPPTLKGEIIKY